MTPAGAAAKRARSLLLSNTKRASPAAAPKRAVRAPRRTYTADDLAKFDTAFVSINAAKKWGVSRASRFQAPVGVETGIGPLCYGIASLEELKDRLWDKHSAALFGVYICESGIACPELPPPFAGYDAHIRYRSFGAGGGAVMYTPTPLRHLITVTTDKKPGGGESHMRMEYANPSRPVGHPDFFVGDYFEHAASERAIGYSKVEHMTEACATFEELSIRGRVIAVGDYNFDIGAEQEDPLLPRDTTGTACPDGMLFADLLRSTCMLSLNGRGGPAEYTRWDKAAGAPGRAIDFQLVQSWRLGSVADHFWEPYDPLLSDHRVGVIIVDDMKGIAMATTAQVPDVTQQVLCKQDRWVVGSVLRQTLTRADELFAGLLAHGQHLNQERWEKITAELCSFVGSKTEAVPEPRTCTHGSPAGGGGTRQPRRYARVQSNTVWWQEHDSDAYRTMRRSYLVDCSSMWQAVTAAGVARARLARERQQQRVGLAVRKLPGSPPGARQGRITRACPTYSTGRCTAPKPAAEGDGTALVDQLWVVDYGPGVVKAAWGDLCPYLVVAADTSTTLAREDCIRATASETAACSAMAAAKARMSGCWGRSHTAFVQHMVTDVMRNAKSHGGLMAGIKMVCGKSARDPPPARVWDKVRKCMAEGPSEVAQAFGPNHLQPLADTTPPEGVEREAVERADRFVVDARKCTNRQDWRDLETKWDLPAQSDAHYDRLNRDIELDETVASANNFKWDTSWGSDGAPTNLIIILVGCAPAMQCVCEWQNRIHRGERLPARWAERLVKMLLKAGQPSVHCDNYRGITLLQIIFKWLEGVYSVRIYELLEATNGVHHTQGGFIKKHACTDSMLQYYIMLEVMGELDTADEDARKAYPTVVQSILFYRCARKGVRGPILLVIMAFYDDAKAVVVVGGAHAPAFAVKMGLAEGSRLSCILWVVYADPVVRDLEQRGIGVWIMGTLIPLLQWADDIRVTVKADGARNLQPAQDVLDSDLRARVQLNNAKKTVWKHDRHTAGMQAPQRATAMQATAGATLTMECMHGGAERHAALKPDKEWRTPDTKANKDSPLGGPHYLKSNLVSGEAWGWRGCDGRDTVPANRIMQVHEHKWLGLLTSDDGMMDSQVKHACKEGAKLRGMMGSLMIASGTMPFTAAAATGFAMFMEKVSYAGILSLPVGMRHDRHSPALAGAIEAELANFGCALTGLHKTAGAPMILAECGWTPVGLHTCRAILIAWRRIAGFPPARHLRTWLLFLVGKLCRRITAWLKLPAQTRNRPSDEDVANYTASKTLNKCDVLVPGKPGCPPLRVPGYRLVCARRFIFAAHRLLGRNGHVVLGSMAASAADGLAADAEWTERIDLALLAAQKRYFATAMQKSEHEAGGGQKAPMSRENLDAGARLGLPFYARCSGMRLEWGQSVGLALIRIIRADTVQTRRKQWHVNVSRRGSQGGAVRYDKMCGCDSDTELGETTAHMVFKCSRTMQHRAQFHTALQSCNRHLPGLMVDALVSEVSTPEAEHADMLHSWS
jgi:hypothetical protein